MRDEVIQKRDYSNSIKGSTLSLKISSYPVTARYLAKRLTKSGNTICELCCGIGISLIEFSRYFDNVVGVDNDPHVVKNARSNLLNAEIGNCELIVGDISDLNVLSQINTDVVAYDIPYWSDHESMLMDKNPELKSIVEKIQLSITPNIVIYAPPHMSQKDFAKMFDNFEYQEIWINGKHDRNFIYLGGLIDSSAITRISLHSY